MHVINTLLDFGSNVNQYSDDSLTPLSIAFLLYYGNDLEKTINIALEHIDPILPSSRITGENEKAERNFSITNNRLDEHKIILGLDTIKIDGNDMKSKFFTEKYLHVENFHFQILMDLK